MFDQYKDRLANFKAGRSASDAAIIHRFGRHTASAHVRSGIRRASTLSGKTKSQRIQLLANCEHGNVEKVLALFEQLREAKSRLYVSWKRYRSTRNIPPHWQLPLSVACRSGRSDIVAAILDNEAGKTWSCDTDMAALLLRIAIRQAHPEVLRELIKHGVSLGSRTQLDFGLMMVAALGTPARSVMVDILVEGGATVNAQNAKGDTALHVAAATGHVDVCRRLMEAGAKLSVCNNSRKTPLFLACAAGSVECLRLFLHQGELDLAHRDCRRDTALHLACQSGSLSTVKMLVEAGALLELRNCDGETPFLRACATGNTEIARWLLEHGKIDTSAVCHRGNSALHVSCRSGSVAMVELLLEQGFDPLQPNAEEALPLFIASGYGHEQVVEALLRRSTASTEQLRALSGPGGVSPLHFACQEGHTRIASRLVDAGCNVGARARDGSTPLHLAAQAGALTIVELLVQRGAKVQDKDNHGATPLIRACRMGHDHVMVFLCSLQQSEVEEGRETLVAPRNLYIDLGKFAREQKANSTIREERRKAESSR